MAARWTEVWVRLGLGVLMAAVGAAGLGGCAASGQYQCPAPIGTIIRDDCEVYQTRYEAMQIGLAAGFSKFKVETSFSDTALRDPSELMQVMSARMLGLCHDFNACRLSPADYQRRREELDRTATAIVALGDQLAAPGRSAEERRRVLDQLLALLAPPPVTRPAPARPGPPAKPAEPPVAPKKIARRAIYSQDPWFDSKLAPPQAPPAAPGFPRLLSGPTDNDIDQSCRTADKKSCYRPRPRIVLWGRHEADDVLELSYDDGQRVRCPVRTSGEGVFRVRCRPPEEVALTAPRYTVRVAYLRAEDEQRVELGVVEQAVARAEINDYSSPTVHFGVDHDRAMGQGWLFFMPEPLALPADFERPYLYATMRYRKGTGMMFPKGSLRCFVDGRAVTPAVGTARGSGETGWFQDTERYVKTGPHSSASAKDPFIVWKHYLFALPYSIARGQASPPGDLPPWPPVAGRWTCKIKVEGELVRELRFELDQQGRPRPLDGQQGRPGDLVDPWWKVETRIVPNRVEGRWKNGHDGHKGGPGA